MYLIYGAGEVGRSYIIKCEKAGITDFDVTDSKPELWGSVLNGHIIISPEDALKRDYEYIIVAAEHVAFQSIVHRLDSCTNNDKVISYGRTIIWDNDPLYDMGNIELTDHLDNGIYLLEEFVSHVNQKRLMFRFLRSGYVVAVPFKCGKIILGRMAEKCAYMELISMKDVNSMRKIISKSLLALRRIGRF